MGFVLEVKEITHGPLTISINSRKKSRWLTKAFKDPTRRQFAFAFIVSRPAFHLPNQSRPCETMNTKLVEISICPPHRAADLVSSRQGCNSHSSASLDGNERDSGSLQRYHLLSRRGVLLKARMSDLFFLFVLMYH